jgi:MFS family permease
MAHARRRQGIVEPTDLGPPAVSLTGPLGESWRAWLALLIGVLAVSAHSAASLAMSVLMKPMLAEFSWARTEFASAMTLRMLVMVMVMPAAGQLTDRFGARLVLVGGASVVGIGYLAIGQISSLAQLYPLMAFIGPGQAGIGSVAASALVLRLFRRRRGLAIGVLNGGDNLINSAVPPLAALSLASAGWRATVALLGGVYLVLGVLIFWALRAGEGVSEGRSAGRTTEVSSRRAHWRDLPWGDGRLWMLFLSYAGIYAFVTSVQLHFHAFQTDMGRAAADASRLLSMQILVGAVGAPLFGWVAERTTARTALLMVVSGLAATSIMLWTGQQYSTFVTWAVLYGLVNSGVVALLTLVLNELFGAEQIGRLMGVAMVCCMSATMLGNLFSAAMFDHFRTYVPAWQAYTALMALTLIPVTLLQRRRIAG